MPLDYPRAYGPGVREVLGDDVLQEVAVDDGVALLRPQIPGRSLLVLHQRPPDIVATLDEADRLSWLAGRAGAPGVVAAGRADEGDEAVVLRLGHDSMSAGVGLPVGPEMFIEAVAAALRAVHELPVERCPFDASGDRLHQLAAQRVADGLVAVAADGAYVGREPADLLAVLADLVSPDTEAVFIHAGLRGDRVWMGPDGTVAFTGWRRAGVGDHHVDLAAAAALAGELYGPAVVAPMLDAYGLDRVDLARLDAAQLLVHLLS
jgi:aminoglycoside phosphotransferase